VTVPEKQAKKRTKALPKANALKPRDTESDAPVPAKGGNWLEREAAELGPQLARPIKESVERWGERRVRFGVKFSASEEETGSLRLEPDFGGRVGFCFRQMDAFGTTSNEFAAHSIGRLADVARRQGQRFATEGDLNAALAVVDGVRPDNEIEAMLAMQMFAAHDSAMDMMNRAKQADTMEALQNYASIATKMQRTFVAQLEALAKLRRGGEQTVRVEHVHVHAGGQAIVGHVTHPGGGTQEKIGQSHEADTRAVVFAPGSPVWSDDPERHGMPEGRYEGQD
jgi:flagellum-specific peptidoglycan hydrolase FlgJ